VSLLFANPCCLAAPSYGQVPFNAEPLEDSPQEPALLFPPSSAECSSFDNCGDCLASGCSFCRKTRTCSASHLQNCSADCLLQPEIDECPSLFAFLCNSPLLTLSRTGEGYCNGTSCQTCSGKSCKWCTSTNSCVDSCANDGILCEECAINSTHCPASPPSLLLFA